MPNKFMLVLAILGSSAMTAACTVAMTGEQTLAVALASASVLVFLAALIFGRD